jgi:hypothetical protein
VLLLESIYNTPQLLVGTPLGSLDGDVFLAIRLWVHQDRSSILQAHCCTSSSGGVIGLVFIIIKLMQGVINKKGSSCSYCP